MVMGYMYWLYHTECGVIIICHVANIYHAVLLAWECFCGVSLGNCFSTNAERSMIDLRVVTAECTLKFHKLRMAEYPYRTSSVTERPPSNFKRPLQSTKQIRRVQ